KPGAERRGQRGCAPGVLVLQEDVDALPAWRGSDLLRPGGDRAGGVVLAPEAHVAEGRGDGEGRRPVLRVGNAESRAVRLEEGEDGFVEPGGVTELEGDLARGGERAQARGQALDVDGEIRGELEEERAAAFAERRGALDERADGVVRVLQPGAVGD